MDARKDACSPKTPVANTINALVTDPVISKRESQTAWPVQLWEIPAVMLTVVPPEGR